MLLLPTFELVLLNPFDPVDSVVKTLLLCYAAMLVEAENIIPH
jgi:hypothetical protein